jgi:hypothetical protein
VGQSQKLLALLDRAEQAGIPVNRAALQRKFNFTISGIVTPGIDISVFVRLGEVVTSLAERDGFTCELRSIVVFPIICNPEVYSRQDFVTPKRKEASYFVGRNIDIEVWKRARKAKRVALATSVLHASVQAITDTNLSLENKARLNSMIDSASKAVVPQ